MKIAERLEDVEPSHLVAESSGEDDSDEIDNDKLKNILHGAHDVVHSLTISKLLKSARKILNRGC